MPFLNFKQSKQVPARVVSCAHSIVGPASEHTAAPTTCLGSMIMLVQLQFKVSEGSYLVQFFLASFQPGSKNTAASSACMGGTAPISSFGNHLLDALLCSTKPMRMLPYEFGAWVGTHSGHHHLSAKFDWVRAALIQSFKNHLFGRTFLCGFPSGS